VATKKPGCGGCKCEGPVCQKNPFCCKVAWDQSCVQLCTQYGLCGGCVSQCEGKQCGSDGCGAVCGYCPPGLQCVKDAYCEPLPTFCGDGMCMGPQEDCKSCPNDCGPCPCEPQCFGKQCGDDGCGFGGVCGYCPPDLTCKSGTCLGPDQCKTDAHCDDGLKCTADACIGGNCAHQPIPGCCEDQDGDKVCDDKDNCKGAFNPDQSDSDKDGVGNVCDNCQKNANPDQANMDGDGQGDACDSDIDGDGIPNDKDCGPKDPKVPAQYDTPCNGKDEDCNGKSDDGAIWLSNWDDGNNGGWTFDPKNQGVGWQVSATPLAQSPKFALYYGNSAAQNYETQGQPNAGSAYSPKITLPQGIKSLLIFSYYFDTEGGTTYDMGYLEIATQKGGFKDWKPLNQKNDQTPMKQWQTQKVEVGPWMGQTVRFRFRFDTVDAVANTSLGVLVDDFMIVAPGVSSVDANGNGIADACEPVDSVPGKTLPWSESFSGYTSLEDGGWYSSTEPGYMGTWSLFSTAGGNPGAGVTALGTMPDFDKLGAWLISPSLEFGGATSAKLQFTATPAPFISDPNGIPQLLVRLSNDNGASWVEIGSVYAKGTTKVSFDLTPFLKDTQPKRIAFLAVGAWSSKNEAWHVDDIFVSP